MVKYVSRFTCIVLFVCILPNTQAGLSGSKHDFTAQSWAGDAGLCEPCHTPHNAIPDQPVLWNHQLSMAAYTPYSSPTLSQPSIGPNGSSKLCLSCHDGAVALDAYGGMSGSTYIQGNARLGTDLSNDHPIGIKWTHKDGAGYNCGVCHNGDPAQSWTLTKRSDMPLYPTTDGSGYTVECISCHDPHNQFNHEHLLRVSNAGSQLCLQCHVK